MRRVAAALLPLLLGTAVPWMAAAVPAEAASQSPLAWVPDVELAPRAAQARTEAAALRARADAADAERATLEARRTDAAAEKERVAGALEELGRIQRGLAESRIRELEARIANLDGRIAALSREAAQARTRAPALDAQAIALDAESAERTRDARNALGLDVDLTNLPDLRLEEARAHYGRRLARVPVQLAAIDRMGADRSIPATTRSALVARANEIRAGRDADALASRRVEEELRYRAGARADEREQAERMLDAAALRASEPTPTVMVVGSARSAELDRALDRILAEQDAQAARVEARRRTLRAAVRGGAVLAVVSAGMAVIVWLTRRA